MFIYKTRTEKCGVHVYPLLLNKYFVDLLRAVVLFPFPSIFKSNRLSLGIASVLLLWLQKQSQIMTLPLLLLLCFLFCQ